MYQEGDLEVWWIAQVPMEAFTVDVNGIYEAMKVLTILAEYDKFQFENNVKPDYCNAGGLNVWEDGEWSTWYSPDGEDINDLIEERNNGELEND